METIYSMRIKVWGYIGVMENRMESTILYWDIPMIPMGSWPDKPRSALLAQVIATRASEELDKGS